MKRDDVIILLLALLLLAGMLFTIFFGGARSRHGVGILIDQNKSGGGSSPFQTGKLNRPMVPPEYC